MNHNNFNDERKNLKSFIHFYNYHSTNSLIFIHFFLQNIPQFLPVMRGTVSLPANRDPEVLERLHPDHFKNMCNRMEVHLNASATQVGTDQAHITTKMKEVGSITINIQYIQMMMIDFKLIVLFLGSSCHSID